VHACTKPSLAAAIQIEIKKQTEMMISREKYDAASHYLFPSDGLTEIGSYMLEAFNGYYGTKESESVMGYIPSKNRSCVAFMEIEPTPESIRQKYPELYGDVETERKHLSKWIDRLCGLKLGMPADQAHGTFPPAASRLTLGRLSGKPLALYVMVDGLILIARFDEAQLKGIQIIDVQKVFEADEALESKDWPKTMEECIAYFE
jgi:hypothetical protein